jgi:hypothetical protein
MEILCGNLRPEAGLGKTDGHGRQSACKKKNGNAVTHEASGLEASL